LQISCLEMLIQAAASSDFPREVGQIPFYYNHKSTGRPAPVSDIVNLEEAKDKQGDLSYVSRLIDVPHSPLFALGLV